MYAQRYAVDKRRRTVWKPQQLGE